VFFDPDGELELSTTAMHYIGGLMEHAKGIAAICNPTVNSYKRFIKGFEAPVDVTWSCCSRSACIRIPDSRGAGTRVELRTPDPTANPYLVFAVMLKAGLEGVRNKIKPPLEYLGKNDTKNEDIYPRDLYQAIRYMKQDMLVKETIGEHAFEVFIKAKQNEWDEYEKQVHDWEIKRYLSIH
jgi:glutamine synthetase